MRIDTIAGRRNSQRGSRDCFDMFVSPVNPRTQGRPVLVLLPLLCLVLLLASCSSGMSSSSPPARIDSGGTSSESMRGDTLNPPVTLDASARSDVFRSTTGAATTLGHLQQGKLMLLYFGYTHCPDVCPTTMASLGTALRELPVQYQTHIQVVFVTSDPARDSPPVMKAWLSNFDNSLPSPFVGLTASLTQIDSVAKSIGIPLSPPTKQTNGTITVQHGAQTLAFVDGAAHVLWLAGTTPGDYTHDLKKLIETVGAA